MVGPWNYQCDACAACAWPKALRVRRRHVWLLPCMLQGHLQEPHGPVGYAVQRLRIMRPRSVPHRLWIELGGLMRGVPSRQVQGDRRRVGRALQRASRAVPAAIVSAVAATPQARVRLAHWACTRLQAPRRGGSARAVIAYPADLASSASAVLAQRTVNAFGAARAVSKPRRRCGTPDARPSTHAPPASIASAPWHILEARARNAQSAPSSSVGTGRGTRRARHARSVRRDFIGRRVAVRAKAPARHVRQACIRKGHTRAPAARATRALQVSRFRCDIPLQRNESERWIVESTAV